MSKVKSLYNSPYNSSHFWWNIFLLWEITVGADYTVVNKRDERNFYQVLHKTDVSDKILQFKIDDKVIKGDSILLQLPKNKRKKVSILVKNNHIDRIFKVGDIITVKLTHSIKIDDNFYIVSADIE